MPRYELGLRTTTVGLNTAGLEIRAAAKRVLVHRIELIMAAAAASVFGLGVPANVPAGGANNLPLAVYPEDTAPFSGLLILAGWTTAPTIPETFVRRVPFPATLAARYEWEPRRPAVIQPAGSLVLWNVTANGAADLNLVVED